MQYFTTTDHIEDALSLFENIHDFHPEFNYAELPWIDKGIEDKPIKVKVDIVPGKEPKKELVRDADTGTLFLGIPQEKKGKVSLPSLQIHLQKTILISFLLRSHW